MKKQLKTFTTAILFLFVYQAAVAQVSAVESNVSASKKGSLHIGSKVPDRFFKVSNYKDKQINLADFKGKWILLDMWGVYCGACIEHMPDGEALQKKFKDSLQVILVTKNTDQQVEKVAKIAENVRKSKLPFINGAGQLSGLCDFSALPEYIWINPNGIIKYITYDEFSEDSVRKLINGKQFDLVEKKTILFAHNNVPIITNLYPVFGDKFFIYSYLAPHDDSKYNYEIAGSSSLGFNGLPKSECGEFRFIDLYKAAYSFNIFGTPLPDERVILDFNDTAHYSDIAKRYDYELIVRKNIPETQVRKYMQSQFDLFFNVSSHLEKRMVPCLVFKTLNNGHNGFTNDRDTSSYDRYGKKMLKVSMHWKELFANINFRDMLPPHTVIDETGIGPDKVVKIDMSLDFDDLEKVAKSLAPYGLTVIKEDRLMDCIIIDDPQ